MGRLLAAVRKEFRQFLRDRLVVALVLFLYTGEIIMCGMALSFDVRNLKLAVYDADRTQLSARLVERFTATDYFRKPIPVAGLREVDRLLDSSAADLALVIPPGLAQSVAAGRSPEVQLILSGVNSNSASAARGYATQIVGRFAHDLAREQAARQGFAARLPGVAAEMRIWYNPQLEFRQFNAISMLITAGLAVGMITAASGLVREKESGTIEQLVVTPLRSRELIAAKAAPPFLTGMLALAPGLVIARALFGVPLAGSVPLFVAASALALAAFLAIGFFVGTVARTLQQALLLTFFILFPLMFLSGTVVPIENTPAAMRALSYLSPVRYYMEIGLGILMKGVGFEVLWPQFAALAATVTLLAAWSIARLKRHLYA